MMKFLQLTRPLFLFGGVNLYAIGVFIALFDGYQINFFRLFAGQVMVTAIQLMTHYANEFYDQETDRLNTERTWFSGGSGVLTEGSLAPRAALAAALTSVAVALIIILYSFTWNFTLALIGVIALALAWSYSGPPLRLVARGTGELAASVVVAGMVPVTGYITLSGGPVGIDVLTTALPLVLIHFAMLIAFAIPDATADAAAGKRTVAVRLGPIATAVVHNMLLLLAFCVILIWIAQDRPGTQWLWLALPIAIWQGIAIARAAVHRPPHYRWLTFGAVGLFAFTALLWLAGCAAPVLGILLAQIRVELGG